MGVFNPCPLLISRSVPLYIRCVAKVNLFKGLVMDFFMQNQRTSKPRINHICQYDWRCCENSVVPFQSVPWGQGLKTFVCNYSAKPSCQLHHGELTGWICCFWSPQLSLPMFCRMGLKQNGCPCSRKVRVQTWTRRLPVANRGEPVDNRSVFWKPRLFKKNSVFQTRGEPVDYPWQPVENP